ncbi:MAG TPA: IS21 family transposase [Nitrospiraceae bacterium]|jgi:transposase|nr:IS21 family transposase [Nitrospiraceae bacterium]
MYKWQQVKALRAQGVSIKKIARKLKLSKNTVRKYLRSPEPPQFKTREYEKLLDPYAEQVTTMLEKHYIGTRIFNELVRIGYTGSLSSVHRYIADKQEDEKIKAKVTTRVETDPGKQMQYDWKEWDLPVEGKLLKIYLHEVVLSYSRKKYYASSLSITSQDVIRAIAGAIDYFGGFADELVIDNPKQMVITHRKNGIVCYNDDFLKVCGLYGIQPNACRNYRARTKGKSERPFYYLQEHLLRGLEVKSLPEFDGKLSAFTEQYNARPHSDLNEPPDERFMREKPLLKEIPQIDPAILYDKPVRKISNDGYISWDGALYPVAMKYALKDVRVDSEFNKMIRVYDLGGQLIAEHSVRLFDKAIRPVHPEHDEINNAYAKKKETYRAETVKKFIETFPQLGDLYVAGLRTAVTANLYFHIAEIMKYTLVYNTADVAAVLSECMEIGAYHKNSVKRLLQSREPQKQSLEILHKPCIIPSADIRRPLSDYKVEAAL